MDEVRCSACGRRNARVEPAVYDEVTRQIKPLPPFGQRMLRGALLLVVACLALLGLEMVSSNRLLSLVGSVAIFAVVCAFARTALVAGRMPKVLSCQCNICGYRWFEKP
jgi:hypothetical protein